MTSTTLVSVIMSAYNAESSIDESILSLLNQTHENIEILIMNDGSTDRTDIKLSDYEKKYSSVKVFTNSKNIGLTKSLNILINAANGEFIARQDSDDISYTTRIEKQISLIEKYNLSFCFSRAINKSTKSFIPRLSFYLPKKILLRYKNPFIHGTLMIRKNDLLNIGLYDEDYFYSQDYKLVSDLINSGYKYKVIREPLYVLNMENNISTNNRVKQAFYADKVKKINRSGSNK
jgi:glycosyltransferase involved in cell wall biosynthesis